MQPLGPYVVLFLLPVMIGIAAALCVRDTRKASLAATLGTILAVYVCLQAGDPEGTWNWLAALLVLPMPVAFALVAVVLRHGRAQTRRRHARSGR
jgi:uncharacterized membrane protein